jgi:hypothetical protein
MMTVIRDFLMVENLPSTKLAVYIFLEMIALAFVLEAIPTLMRGGYRRGSIELILGIIFMFLGVKSEQITKQISTSVNWSLWGRRVAIASRILLGLSVIAVLVTGYYLIHGLTSISRIVPPSSPAPSSPPTPSEHTAPSKAVDWHDKQNWRHFLHTGMSKTEVRSLFGDPEQISVYGDIEFWDYGGHAEITFADGSLYSWTEP